MRYLNIEVGCANYADPRFEVRVDIKPTKATTMVVDMRDMSVFLDSTFAFLKSAATLEHVSPDDQIKTVREFHRVLIPHGIVWIQTPDLDWIDSLKETNPEWYQTQMTGGMVDEFDQHLGLLNKETITKLFTENGFRVLQLHDGSQAAGSLDLYAEALP
jgi:predicted SAM-dependent methyltransferase